MKLAFRRTWLRYWPLYLVLFYFIWMILNERINHPHQAKVIQVDLGTFRLANKEGRSPVDPVALRLISCYLSQRRSFLSPVVNGVNILWIEIYSPDKMSLRRMEYFQERLRDIKDNTRFRTASIYTDVSPAMLQALSERAEETHITSNDLTSYGCTKKFFRDKSSMSSKRLLELANRKEK